MKIIYSGTTVYVEYKFDGLELKGNYIVAETHDKDFVFQIVGIEGNDSGRIMGYIKYDPNIDNVSGVTIDYFKSQLEEMVFMKILKMDFINEESGTLESVSSLKKKLKGFKGLLD